MRAQVKVNIERPMISSDSNDLHNGFVFDRLAAEAKAKEEADAKAKAEEEERLR